MKISKGGSVGTGWNSESVEDKGWGVTYIRFQPEGYIETEVAISCPEEGMNIKPPTKPLIQNLCHLQNVQG